jgi:hypothetical protein
VGLKGFVYEAIEAPDAKAKDRLDWLGRPPLPMETSLSGVSAAGTSGTGQPNTSARQSLLPLNAAVR